MVAYSTQPTISPLTSCLPWNTPQLRWRGNNISLGVGVKPPKFTKVSAANYNMGSGKMHDILHGRMVADGIVFQQELVVRSFDVNGDSKMSSVALANYLQDTALNHFQRIGLLSDGFSTREMSTRDLIWVSYKMDIAIDCYPCWHDVIQVKTWIYESGKNGFGVDWIFSNLKTGNPLMQASGVYRLMNMKTRKLSKLIEEVKKELEPYIVVEWSPLVKNTRKLQIINIDTADFTRPNLSPEWNDIDMNEHVNNTKYFEWILQGTPSWIMRSHQLSNINLEFRKECSIDVTLKSLSKYVENYNSKSDNSTSGNVEGLIEVMHSLRLDSGLEVARGRTLWNPKHPQQLS